MRGVGANIIAIILIIKMIYATSRTTIILVSWLRHFTTRNFLTTCAKLSNVRKENVEEQKTKNKKDESEYLLFQYKF